MPFWETFKSIFIEPAAPPVVGELVAAPSVAVEDRSISPAAATEKRSIALTDPRFWHYFNLGSNTLADVTVTDETSLGCPPFFSAVSYIASGVAMLDRTVKRRKNGNVQDADDHPVTELMNMKPHPYYTWHDMLCALLTNACLGNGYLRIHRDEFTQRPVYLEHIPQYYVTPDFDHYGNLIYRISGTLGGRTVNLILPSSDIIHIKGLSLDGITGLRTTFLHADTHGTGIARGQYSSSVLGKGARPSVAVKNDNDMTLPELEQAEANFQARYGGSQNAGRPWFLGPGQDVTYLQWSPLEAALIELSNLNVADVSRITKVPLDLLAVENGGTYGAGVQRSKDFLLHCLSPWIEKIQEEFNAKLFYITEQRSRRYFFEFDTSMYLALDKAEEAEVLVKFVAGSIMTPNEARQKIGLAAVQGGDELLTDINQVPLKNVLEVALAKYLSSQGEKAQADAESQAQGVEDAAAVIQDKSPKGEQKTDTSNEQPKPQPQS